MACRVCVGGAGRVIVSAYYGHACTRVCRVGSVAANQHTVEGYITCDHTYISTYNTHTTCIPHMCGMHATSHA